MAFIKIFSDIKETDLPLVGGKGLNLGLLVEAGFSVPDGFCVTTDAYKHAIGQTNNPAIASISQDMADEILSAYSQLGSGKVAVRSSATAEDLPDASFAGQQDTFLNIQGNENLLEAIKDCWASLRSERAIAYRSEREIDDSLVSMSVVIQKMLQPDSSGVMFSVSPADEKSLMIESSWGLGEAIVSGKVMPDSFTVDRDSLQIADSAILSKKVMITEAGELEVPAEKQAIPSLKEEQIIQLARMGLEVEKFYSAPQDMEWALVNDELYLLQSRPITVSGTDSEVEELRQEEIAKLQEMAENTGTVWCRFNLAETLPEPLPMTWAIISKFMSGHGGFGLTYKELGFMPGKEVDEKGVVDLICGRAFFNLSREARLYFDEYPLEHNFQKLKENPASASYPEPTVNIKRSSFGFWFKFPYYIHKMLAADRNMKRIRKDYASKLRTKIFPEYCQYIQEQKKIKLSELSDADVISKFHEWVDKILHDSAKDGLIASILAGMSYNNLQTLLIKCFGDEGKAMLDNLIVGLDGDLTVKTNQKLWEVAHDRLSKNDFLHDYGHRAAGEFELAQPRWRENPDYVENMIQMYREHEEFDPEAQHNSQKKRREEAESDLNNRLSSGKAKAYSKQILKELEYAQKYLPYRETAKFYLMMGYELIRNALVELGNRCFGSEDDIFYLVPEELPELMSCKDPSIRESLHRKAMERKHRRNKLLSIDLPDVIFSDSLDQIGDPPLLDASEEMDGTPVSGGVATSEAKVLLKPPQSQADMETGYILVCPSTDPGWAPLFPGARGLVMERGGALSHGAIVAREYGIPAVANIPGATKLIKDGQRIKVDGNKGKVSI